MSKRFVKLEDFIEDEKVFITNSGVKLLREKYKDIDFDYYESIPDYLTDIGDDFFECISDCWTEQYVVRTRKNIDFERIYSDSDCEVIKFFDIYRLEEDISVNFDNYGVMNVSVVENTNKVKQ